MEAKNSPTGFSEAQDQSERVVDRSQLIGIQSTGRAAKALWIDDGGLLDEDARFEIAQRDRRPKGGRQRSGRRRRYERRTQRHELIGLDDDRITRPSLLMSSGSSR